MNLKYLVYVFSTILVVWAMDCLNINGIFKKNRVMQARVMYFIIALCIIYIISRLLFDFIEISQFN